MHLKSDNEQDKLLKNELIDNGILTIPLYHGTSSLFLTSIREQGLGGVNPIKQFQVREFFAEIFKRCDTALAGDKEWEACKFVAEYLRDQVSNGDSSNYQHGDTYLSPSRASAVGYALTNKFGSELISNAHRLLSFVQERRPELLEDNEIAHHQLLNFFGYDHKPVVLKMHNIPVSILSSECGDSPEKGMDFLIDMLPFLNDSGVVVNSNFRLLRPVPFDACEVEFIDPVDETNPFAW
jgi:hypothetical protein